MMYAQSRKFIYDGPRSVGEVNFKNINTMTEILKILSKGEGKQRNYITYENFEKNTELFLPDVSDEYTKEILDYIKQRYLINIQKETFHKMKDDGEWNFDEKKDETIEKFKNINNTKWDEEKKGVYVRIT